jgi:S1-C subfamily serine protease
MRTFRSSRVVSHARARARLLGLRAAVLGLSLLVGTGAESANQDTQLEASILRVKPAVVLISSDVEADVEVSCGDGSTHHVRPDPIYETGSGFVVHPDGFIATNGHVVTRFYEMNERQLAGEFLKKAVAQACGPALAMVPDGARNARLLEIVADPVNQGKVQLSKRLLVHLSTGVIYQAEVKAYSPAIKSEEGPSGGERASVGGKLEPERSGKDVAILKVGGHDFPTVRLAPNSAALKLGEQIFVVGYPGVVLNHDFLSRKSRLEASVTVGRVSGFKTDLNDRRVIQTDAAITWGNSGGPALNLRGEVIGAATFISTTLEGDQAIQGFNFLIPVESFHEFGRQIGLVPNPDAPFTKAWTQAVDAYFRGEYRRSLEHTDAALRIMPGFPDLDRLHAEVQMRVDGHPRFLRRGMAIGLGIGLIAAGILLGTGVRAWRRRGRGATSSAALRIDPEDLRRRLDAGSGVTLVDARHGAAFDGSPVQAAGAVRFDIDHPDELALRIHVNPDGEVVAYCT